MVSVAILVCEGVFDSGLSVLLDILHQGLGQDSSLMMVQAANQTVRTARGLIVEPTHSIEEAFLSELDLLVVPGLPFPEESELLAWLASDEVEQVCGVLTKAHGEGILLAAGCTGTFLLGRAGVLRGKRATCTKGFGTLFETLYPDVSLDFSSMITRSDGVICSGSAMAHVELGLFLLSILKTPARAERVAQDLVLDQREDVLTLRLEWLRARPEPWLQDAYEIVSSKLKQGIGVSLLAEELGWSRKTLHRRMKFVALCSPQEFIRTIRLQIARRFLADSDLNLERIAEEVGYRDSGGLRKAFREGLGRTPSSYRH